MLYTPSKHSRICAKHFTAESFEQHLVVRSLLGLFLSFVNL